MDEATIRLHIEPLAEGGFVATSPDVPGLVVERRSITEAVEIAQAAAGLADSGGHSLMGRLAGEMEAAWPYSSRRSAS